MSVTINAKGTSVPSFAIGKNGMLLEQAGQITPPAGNDLITSLSENNSLVVDSGPEGQSLITTTVGQDLYINPAVGGGQNLFLGTIRWPRQDGENGQIIATDGNGVLTFVDAGSIAEPLGEIVFGTGPGIDTAPTLTFDPQTTVLSVGDLADGFIDATHNLTLTAGTNGAISIYTNTLERLTITSTGAFEIANNPGALGQVLTSSGSGAPPTWQVARSVAPDFEEFTATADQKTFRTTVATVARGLGKIYLQIFVNGKLQREGNDRNYMVTDMNEITFNTGLSEGDDVVIYSFV